MILFPNAKINIGLDITSRRPDGYHNLVSLMVPVKWTDILEIVPARGTETTLTVTGRGVDCPPEKNLVMKAYRALEQLTPLPPVDIYLEKIIPDGAGLGGGSSDAAFTLRGLNELFALDLSDETLAGIASTLGADCPFFIYSRPMICEGIGDIMTPVDIDLSAYTIALVKPPHSVSTREAYSAVVPAIPPVHLSHLIATPVNEWRGNVKNDFEPSVGALLPEIGIIKERLYALGAEYASMSGSGSTVYGLFSHDILSADLAAEFPDCLTFVS